MVVLGIVIEVSIRDAICIYITMHVCSLAPGVMVTHVVSSQSAGCVMFGMLVGSLSATISAGRMGEQVYSKKMDTLREFFKVRDAKVLRRFWFHAFAHPGIRTLCSYGPFALTDVTYSYNAFTTNSTALRAHN